MGLTLKRLSARKKGYRDLWGKIRRSLAYLILIIFVIYALLPIIWGVSLSFKPPEEFFTSEIIWISKTPTLDHYYALFFGTLFPRWMSNSLFVSSCYALLVVLISSMAGYAFAFHTFRGKNTLFFMALLSLMVPSYLFVIPWYLMLHQVNLLNTYVALILPGAATGFSLFFMRVYIRGAVHPDFLEAARVDGASELSVFFKIVFPIIAPGTATLFIMAFTLSFNSFLWPMMAMQSPEMFTIPVGMASWVFVPTGVSANTYWANLYTGSVVSIVPVLIIFIVAQKRFVGGLVLGAPKG
jgi:multiple sugar transport system permease protein